MDTQSIITDQPPATTPIQSPSIFSDPKSTSPSKLPLIILTVLTLIFATTSVYFFTKLKKTSLSAPSVTISLPSPSAEEKPFDNNIPPMFSTEIIKDFISSSSAEPESWTNSTVSGLLIASDLMQVCVHNNNSESLDQCHYFEYWTNNRTGKWELLASFSAGQEGPTTCEDWQKWKVAKGMDCIHLNGGTGKVNFN